jgi:hypothetical protein
MFYKVHVFCINVTKADVYFIVVAVTNKIKSNLKANTVYLINMQHLHRG